MNPIILLAVLSASSPSTRPPTLKPTKTEATFVEAKCDGRDVLISLNEIVAIERAKDGIAKGYGTVFGWCVLPITYDKLLETAKATQGKK